MLLFNLLVKLKTIAELSQNEEKHAAALIKGRKAIGYGYNRYDRCKSQVALGSFSTHAEIDVLRLFRAKRYRSIRRNCQLIVVKLSKRGGFGESKPCLSCLRALKQAGITKIHYTTKDGKIVTQHIDQIKSYGESSGTRFLRRKKSE